MTSMEVKAMKHWIKDTNHFIKAFDKQSAEFDAILTAYETKRAARAWRENLVNGFDFEKNQTSAHNMTEAEKREWSDKFFEE